MADESFLKNFGVGGFAGLSGNVGDALTIAGAVEDLKSSDSSLSPEKQKEHTEHSNNLAISSGVFGLLTNTLGLIDNFTNKETSGASKVFGATEGILGLLYGGANIASGAAGKADAKGIQKAAGITGGAINMLGGIAGIGKSISNYSKLKEDGKTGEAWKSLIVGGLGGAGKIFSGVTGAGAAAKPNSRGWKKWNVGAAAVGGLVGGTDTLINTGMALYQKYKKPGVKVTPVGAGSSNQLHGSDTATSSGESTAPTVISDYGRDTIQDQSRHQPTSSDASDDPFVLQDSDQGEAPVPAEDQNLKMTRNTEDSTT